MINWLPDQAKLTAGGAAFEPKRHLVATNALARMKDDPRAWFEELCQAGMPHHVAVAQGHHAALLQRMARVMNIPFV